MRPESGVRIAMGVLYAITGLIAIQRFSVLRCGSLPQPGRLFHLILALFAIIRAVDMFVGVEISADAVKDDHSIILSRVAICLFFSLCSHVVAQW